MKFYIVLGDQLNLDSNLLSQVDKRRDFIWMAEVQREATRVWSHKARIVLFLSAMRHFHQQLNRHGYRCIYHELDSAAGSGFSDVLQADIEQYQPDELLVVQPGEYGVLTELQAVAKRSQLQLSCLEDRHFICSRNDFDHWFATQKQPRQEYFYRYLRKRTGYLMQKDKPEGGTWNYDKQNRKSFSRAGPGILPAWPAFKPDRTTREVTELVETLFSGHPGSLENFDWPVTREQAMQMLDDFIAFRLPAFGDYQDAMWTDEYFLYHSGLSASLNLKLLDPREVIEKALAAYEKKRVSLASVEGFVRQILGWREYVHGLYWQLMPEYLENNALRASADLPGFYWSGQTDMRCLQEVIRQTLEYGYAHHIQRLMVTGLFALLLGVRPQQVHAWYLAVYVDAVEWVELPNTLGMSQYADGGVLASKPYVASGKYIQRMSNYCEACRYNPADAIGEDACPFTTLYWDFLQRHKSRFARHPRTALQWRNLERLDVATRKAITEQAIQIRRELAMPD